VAVSGRRDQEASFFTVIVWRDQAEHAAQSLAKGSRIVVLGRLQQRSWTAEDGSAPVRGRGHGRRAGPESALGNGDHDQDDKEPGPVATLTSDAVGRDAGGRAGACRRLAPSFRAVEELGDFSLLSSRPALRAAATGGRPRPAGPRWDGYRDTAAPLQSWTWSHG
jgi:hypothetical protein